MRIGSGKINGFGVVDFTFCSFGEPVFTKSDGVGAIFFYDFVVHFYSLFILIFIKGFLFHKRIVFCMRMNTVYAA